MFEFARMALSVTVQLRARKESRMRNRRPTEALFSRALAELPSTTSEAPRVDLPHGLEHAVHRRLLAQPGLQIASLVIRRIPNGVCLEGVLESDPGQDICNLARSVAGVEQVLNHLVFRPKAAAAAR
jgi:hypothetical protein